MLCKIYNWILLGIMTLAGVTSLLAAFSHDYDKATYFLLVMISGHFVIDKEMKIW